MLCKRLDNVDVEEWISHWCTWFLLYQQQMVASHPPPTSQLMYQYLLTKNIEIYQRRKHKTLINKKEK